MNLKEARTKARMTQLELCVATKIHQSRLSRMEKGYEWVKKIEAESIAKALGFNLRDISYSHNMVDRRESNILQPRKNT